MKIVFLCGALEPGCDGVGDYTRSLALELISYGNEIAIISINDPYISDEIYRDKRPGNGLAVYRIPAVFSENKRFYLAKKWVAEINPEWVSIQFVIYSFHPKGLPWNIGKNLKEIVSGRKCHLMFHEIWIGFTKISTLKHRVTGFFQRRIVLSLVNQLPFCRVTTTNRLYQVILSENNVSAYILPLFSNIPVAPVKHTFTKEVFSNFSISDETLHEWVLAGIFGNLYPQAKLENAIRELLDDTTSRQKKLAFIGFGKMNSEGLAEFDRLAQIFLNRVQFVHLGEQPSENVSNLLQMLNVGFSCTPTQHIGKSGVFAAMKLHNLKVILPTAEVIPEYDAEIKKYQQHFINRHQNKWSVSYIATQFLKVLDDSQANNYNE